MSSNFNHRQLTSSPKYGLIWLCPSVDHSLSLTFINELGNKSSELVTAECRQQVVAPSMFDCPAGFRRVKSESAAILDPDKQGVLNDMMGVDEETRPGGQTK